MWNDIVDRAIDEAVDGVLVSGDIIDEESAYFEAFGPFEDGAEWLNNADIPTFIVAGNHDYDTVPSLIENLGVENVHQLGGDGNWERHTVGDESDPAYHVDGWSFTTRHEYGSPMESYDLGPAEAPVIGLLHGDLDQQESDYAPVPKSALESAAADAWVLGHIHTSGKARNADPAIFYPGSPQGLAPNESGHHGPWLMECSAAGSVNLSHLQLAKVRYEPITIDVSDVDDIKGMPAKIRRELTSHVKDAFEAGVAEVVLARITLTGRTDIHRDIDTTPLTESIQPRVSGISVRVEQLENETRPAIDLEQYTDPTEPVGYLATLIRDLENDELESYSSLIQESMGRIEGVATAPSFTPLANEQELPDPTEERAQQRLLRQASALLIELLEQKEEIQ